MRPLSSLQMLPQSAHFLRSASGTLAEVLPCWQHGIAFAVLLTITLRTIATMKAKHDHTAGT